MNNKSPLIAFLLAFFPGGGLLYLGKVLRGLFYTLSVFGLPLIGILMSLYDEFLIIMILISCALYLINFIDTTITASRLYKEEQHGKDNKQTNEELERFFTIILSMIPGLGHFQLGLMNRGISLLATFLGLGAMIFFVAILLGQTAFLTFLILLPVIWLFGFFDTMQQLAKKQRGEELNDQSLIEEFEMKRNKKNKSRAIATFLSIFPGVGHLYLGMQKRGIQLMAAFLFAIYILDGLRLGLFLFLVPIIWFYSFFDGLQKASKYGEGPLEDDPVISFSANEQKWLGVGLILLGLYYLLGDILLPIVHSLFGFHVDIYYFEKMIVSILLIGGGIKLMRGRKQRKVIKENKIDREANK